MVSPTPETALLAIERAVALLEQVEQMRQKLRVDADARIMYFQPCIDRRAVDEDIDARKFRRIFAGIRQQVCDYLAEPHTVAVHETFSAGWRTAIV
jgi:hypothetical protein